MSRAIISLATGSHYMEGLKRLEKSLDGWGETPSKLFWRDRLPPGCPPHHVRQYAFKSFCLKSAVEQGFTKLLWCDSCIVLNQPLERIWQRAAVHGAWISKNGYPNSQWTSDAAYPILFPGVPIEEAREVNRGIEHVVATTFALDLDHPVGRRIFDMYTYYGTQTDAFCGPWANTPTTPCGPPECSGFRHDQTCLSVAAWRCDLELTQAPNFFAYLGGENDSTIALADGGHKRPV